MKTLCFYLLFCSLIVHGANGKSSHSLYRAVEKKTQVRKINSEVPYSLNAFYVDAKVELEKSLKKVSLIRVEKSVKLSKLLSAAEDPWTLTNTIKTSESTFEPKYKEHTSLTKLKYLNQNGFGFSTYVDLYDNSAWLIRSSRDSHTNLGFNISQELLSGWSRSKFAAEQEIEDLKGQGRIQEGKSSFLNETLSVIDLSHSLYTAYCKKKDLEKLNEYAKETLRITEVQHSARTISTRDWLRIQETYNNMQRQIQANSYEIKSYESKFSVISNDAYMLAKKLNQMTLACEDGVNNINKITYPSRSNLSELLKNHPGLKGIELQKDAAKKQVEIYKIQRRPSWVLESGFERIHNVTAGNPSYNNYYVGLNFSYQFQGDQAQLYKQSLAEQFADLSLSQKQRHMDLNNYLTGLFDQIEYNISQVPLAQKSLENSAKLLKIIQTQQQIGQLDAAAIESAYTSYTTSMGQIREIWSQVSSTALKLSEISK